MAKKEKKRDETLPRPVDKSSNVCKIKKKCIFAARKRKLTNQFIKQTTS
jgi:hypothetical protein